MKKLFQFLLFVPLFIVILVIVSKRLPSKEFTSTQPEVPAIQTGLSFLEQASQMTLKEKVRQVLICGYRGTDINKALQKSGNCGNFLIFGENVKDLSPDQISQNNAAIHQYDPLTWMMVDQEGGTIARIKDNSPSPRKMAETNTVSFWGNSQGKLLKSLGFDINLAPVADITRSSPVIRNRSFADNPDDESNYVNEYLNALQTNGIAGVLKHLPGHGRVLVDTHSQTGTLNYTWNEIKKFDILPFVNSINNGAEIVLIGHIIIPELDSRPASVSENTIAKFREFLPRGSEIIFMSDSLIMKGVGLSMDKAPTEALKAGEDMVIINGFDEELAFNKIVEAYNSGYLDENKLNVSVSRILKVKSRFGESKSLSSLVR